MINVNKNMGVKMQTKHASKMIDLLRYYAAQGRSLHGADSVCVPMRRSPLTIMKYCRRANITLSDYSSRKPVFFDANANKEEGFELC